MAKARAKKVAGSFKSAVLVSACLKRPVDSHGDVLKQFKDQGDYNGVITQLHMDVAGNLIGTAECGDNAIVCTKDELPVLIAFLQSIVEG